MMERLLDSLQVARQRYDGPSEVLVIDSSPIAEARAIQDLCLAFDASYVTGPDGVHQKRNIGIRRARFPTVLFIDSDCEADPALLTEHHIALAAASDQIAGVLGLTNLVGPRAGAWRAMEVSGSFTAAFNFARWFREVPWGTCTNLSVRKEILETIGGFDETLPGPVYGEDVDLGFRITGMGYRIRTNPNAIVDHPRDGLRRYRQGVRKAIQTGRADIALGVRHPGRLALEFPTTPVLLLLFAIVSIARVVLYAQTVYLLMPLMWIMLVVIAQALWRKRTSKLEGVRLLDAFGAVGLEMAFESSKLFFLLRRRQWRRLWLKLVYVREQLIAEREWRIAQMWVSFLAAVLALGVTRLLEAFA